MPIASQCETFVLVSENFHQNFRISPKILITHKNYVNPVWILNEIEAIFTCQSLSFKNKKKWFAQIDNGRKKKKVIQEVKTCASFKKQVEYFYIT